MSAGRCLRAWDVESGIACSVFGDEFVPVVCSFEVGLQLASTIKSSKRLGFGDDAAMRVG